MKKGFTLIELMGSVIILGFLAVIIAPKINSYIKDSKESALNTQVEQIKKAAENWSYKNAELLPENDEVITLTLGQLKRANLIGYNIRNPKTGKLFPNDMVIEIKKHLNTYIYDVLIDSGTTDFENVDENSPILVLNGNYIDYIEINTPYIETGAVARSRSGVDITNKINIQYLHNGNEVSSINTSSFNTYSIVYTVNDNNHVSKAIRTVIINDTIAPVLNVPENETIHLSQVGSYNKRKNVTVTDNSNIEPTLEISGQIEQKVGKYIITYKATDTKKNETVKKRVITVVE